MMRMPFQKALKLPATMPERIVSDEPPSREAVTISWTCLECELVKILVNSGISTAASVPQLMIVASCHQRLPRVSTATWAPPSVTSFHCEPESSANFDGSTPAMVTDRSLSSIQLMKKEVEMHRIDAIQIRRVRGASKLKSRSPRYCFSEIAWLTK